MLRTGLDRLLISEHKSFGRIGWLVNGAAVTSDGLLWGPREAQRCGFNVVQLFGAEHGPHSAVKEGERIEDGTDDVTGLPICSLYSMQSEHMREALTRCDTVMIDLVDIGARYSTYLATATALLEGAAGTDVKIIVLDRPNILGRRMEGPGLDPDVRSFVGKLNIPIRHGLTLGEIMRWHKRMSGLDTDLEVLEVTGWPLRDGPSQIGPYLPPSPNLNSLATQLLYVGTCLVEGTNLSEGRGTANPFRLVGAPWLDAEELSRALLVDPPAGCRFRPARFVPLASKHAGYVCHGVFIHVGDLDSVQPLELGVRLLSTIFSQSDQAELLHNAGESPRFIDLLWGSGDLAAYLKTVAAGDSSSSFAVGSRAEFQEEVDDDLLYR